MMRLILNCCLVLLLPLGALAFVAGCGSGDDDASGGESGTVVTATTTTVADIASNVAGERASVTAILPANADPHDYEPAPSDAEALADSDVVLRSGGDLDLWLDDLAESSGTDAPVLSLIDFAETLPGAEEGEETDPHWWQNPRNAIAATAAIRDALVEADPDGRAEYTANARRYTAELEALDRGIAGCMEGVPVDERKLVTSHDALGYYADRYDVEVIGAAIPALSTQAQASAGQTADLVELIRAEDVKAIFPEAGVSAELEETIAEEAGAGVGGELWADTLGPEGSDGATYLEAMRSNTEKLVEGFTGGRRVCSGMLFPGGGTAGAAG